MQQTPYAICTQFLLSNTILLVSPGCYPLLLSTERLPSQTQEVGKQSELWLINCACNPHSQMPTDICTKHILITAALQPGPFVKHCGHNGKSTDGL